MANIEPKSHNVVSFPTGLTKKLRKAYAEMRREERRKASVQKPGPTAEPQAKPVKAAKAAKKKRRARTLHQIGKTKSFYATIEWKRLRYDALKRSKGRCECCGMSPADGITLVVDHIKPRRYHPELSLVLANLQVLCNSCNLGKGSRDETDWRDDSGTWTDSRSDLDREYEAIMAGD